VRTPPTRKPTRKRASRAAGVVAALQRLEVEAVTLAALGLLDDEGCVRCPDCGAEVEPRIGPQKTTFRCDPCDWLLRLEAFPVDGW
jgi:tRNA(Ile2) C34 agmatinyltransferase TiaS